RPVFFFGLSLLCGVAPSAGQSIFRLTDPLDFEERYGKSPYESPPFLHYASTQQHYHFASAAYSPFASSVAAAVASWNSVFPVHYSFASSGAGVSLIAVNLGDDRAGASFPGFDEATYEIEAA